MLNYSNFGNLGIRHCMIHGQALSKKVFPISTVMDQIIKIVNFIKEGLWNDDFLSVYVLK